MQYVRLGATGLEVSRVCLGMMSYGSPRWQPWVLPAGEAKRFVTRALDHGINFFDTADFYSGGASEEALGAALDGTVDRSEVVIATKVGLPMGPGPNRGGLSRKHILRSIDDSLRRLRTDHVDLYQLHRADPGTPIEETVETLHDLVRAGKVLHVGASNFAAWQFARAAHYGRWVAGLRFSAMQLQYNLAYREDARDLIPLCGAEGIGIVGYSPLARGFLAGNRAGDGDGAPGMSEREAVRASGDVKAHVLYGTEADRLILDRLTGIAEARGLPPARIAMAWVLSRPFMSSIICGALEERHLDEAVAALDLRLSAEEEAALEEAYLPRPVKDDAFEAVAASAGNRPSGAV